MLAWTDQSCFIFGYRSLSGPVIYLEVFLFIFHCQIQCRNTPVTFMHSFFANLTLLALFAVLHFLLRRLLITPSWSVMCSCSKPLVVLLHLQLWLFQCSCFFSYSEILFHSSVLVSCVWVLSTPHNLTRRLAVLTICLYATNYKRTSDIKALEKKKSVPFLPVLQTSLSNLRFH